MGTTSASLQGGFYVPRTTSSLYHLLLLGFQRFYAIKWPLKYKRQGFGSTFSAIMFVWAIAFAASLAPGKFLNFQPCEKFAHRKQWFQTSYLITCHLETVLYREPPSRSYIALLTNH